MKPTGRSSSLKAIQTQPRPAQAWPAAKARTAALEAAATIAWAMAPLVVTAIVAFA